MDTIDEQLLNLLQRAFPITEKPYLALGQELGISEQEALERVGKLRAEGLIRSISAVFEPSRLGLKSALVAARVEPDRLEEVAQAVGQFAEVTHNYGRADENNLWFTITAGSEERLREIAAAVGKLPGVKQVAVLPTVRKFKLQVQFDAGAGGNE